MSSTSSCIDSKKSFRVLRRQVFVKIAITSIFMTAIVIGIFFLGIHNDYKRHAEAQSRAARSSIIIGDLVSLSQLSKQALINFKFIKVQILRSGKIMQFGVFEDYLIRISKPVSSGEYSAPLAFFHFYYDPTPLIPIAFVILLALFFVSLMVFRGYEKQLIQEWQTSTSLAKAKMKNEFALQVAHDIRSPVQALETVAFLINSGQGANLDLINTATSRIKRIASDLLEIDSDAIPAHQFDDQVHSAKGSKIELVSSLLDIVEEKKVQQHQIRIEFRATNCQSLKVSDSTALGLQRILSNLINNSVEAGASSVDIIVGRKSDSLSVTVIDDGKGMSEEFVSKLRGQRLTDKSNGHGLGISYAIKFFEASGGKLQIHSKQGIGTQIDMHLPIKD